MKRALAYAGIALAAGPSVMIAGYICEQIRRGNYMRAALYFAGLALCLTLYGVFIVNYLGRGLM